MIESNGPVREGQASHGVHGRGRHLDRQARSEPHDMLGKRVRVGANVLLPPLPFVQSLYQAGALPVRFFVEPELRDLLTRCGFVDYTQRTNRLSIFMAARKPE